MKSGKETRIFTAKKFKLNYFSCENTNIKLIFNQQGTIISLSLQNRYKADYHHLSR